MHGSYLKAVPIDDEEHRSMTGLAFYNPYTYGMANLRSSSQSRYTDPCRVPRVTVRRHTTNKYSVTPDYSDPQEAYSAKSLHPIPFNKPYSSTTAFSDLSSQPYLSSPGYLSESIHTNSELPNKAYYSSSSVCFSDPKSMSAMEFSQFRDTGELSDLTVSVDGKEYKLHKFPLFIKSDFFRALARAGASSNQESIELDNFPGGSITFEQVANYCYNVRIELTRDNICKLRCAAEFLQMGSRGNLVDTTDRYLTDILTSAKLSRDFDSIADLILQCKELGGIAEQSKVVDKCLMAVIDCWLLSTKYTKRITGMDSWTAGVETREKLYKMPLAWFHELFTNARDKAVRPGVLADLVQSYIDYIIDGKIAGEETVDEPAKAKQELSPEEKDDLADALEKATEGGEEQDEASDKDDDDEQKTETKNTEEEKQEEDKGDEQAKDDEKSENADDAQSGDTDDKKQEDKKIKEEAANQETVSTTKETDVDEVPTDTQIAVTLDTIIPEIPENILMADFISPHWALRVLQIAIANECKCTDSVRKLVSRVVYRLAPQDLVQLPDDMLIEIVRESCKDGENPHQGVACSLVDTYLAELSARDKLTVDTFNKMVDVVPNQYRFSHDTLFQVLESLLKSVSPQTSTEEKVKLTDEQKQSLLESIDYSRLSEAALLRAYETELVPQNYVTKAALELCVKLRAELEDAHKIIKAQEFEMEKYSTAKYTSYYSKPQRVEKRAPHVPREPRRRHDRDPLRHSYAASSSNYVTPTPYSSPGVPTLASDAELQMVLDSLDKTSEVDYPLRPSDTYAFRSSAAYTPLFDERALALEAGALLSQSLPPRHGAYYSGYRY